MTACDMNIAFLSINVSLTLAEPFSWLHALVINKNPIRIIEDINLSIARRFWKDALRHSISFMVIDFKTYCRKLYLINCLLWYRNCLTHLKQNYHHLLFPISFHNMCIVLTAFEIREQKTYSLLHSDEEKVHLILPKAFLWSQHNQMLYQNPWTSSNQFNQGFLWSMNHNAISF